MEKHKLIGITEYAKDKLSIDDLNALREMVGCEVEISDDVADDGGALIKMPDGEDTHIKFLILSPKFN